MPFAPSLPPRPPKHAAAPRESTEARGYGTSHRRIRARLIALYPLCQRCGRGWSHHLHHRDRNPLNRADSNLEMLCVPCHQVEHRAG